MTVHDWVDESMPATRSRFIELPLNDF